MNTDEDPNMASTNLKRNGLLWPQAALPSIKDVITNMRIHIFPTTLLIDPEGKIVSLNQHKKNQPELRGRELLKSLDQLLPP
jgi:hypothetical protein